MIPNSIIIEWDSERPTSLLHKWENIHTKRFTVSLETTPVVCSKARMKSGLRVLFQWSRLQWGFASFQWGEKKTPNIRKIPWKTKFFTFQKENETMEYIMIGCQNLCFLLGLTLTIRLINTDTYVYTFTQKSILDKNWVKFPMLLLCRPLVSWNIF